MKRLVLIDGNAILHRAFYALPDTLTLKDGTPVNAVYGFVSMLLRIVQDLRPTHVICSFDLPKPTFRDKLYEDYRAQRPPTPDKLVAQVKLVKDVVRAFEIPIYEVEGYEADDVIGTLAHQADGDTIIVTGDRDLLQLVNGYTKVYIPIKGLTQAKLYGIEEVEEKYGIHPKQMVDYKALVGDPSDNYPGVKGIGPKTAVQLIKEYGTLEKLYKSLDTSSKVQDALVKYKEDALMAKKLAKIVTDVPVKLDLDKAKLTRLDTLEVKEQFDKLAFRTLWKRIKEMGGEVNKIKKDKVERENDTQLSML